MLQVHQRQTERMRARSDWFLSDWPGGGGRGSGGCGSGLVTYRPVASRILSPRPTSLVAMSPSKSPPSTEAPVTSLDNVMTAVTGKPPDGQTQGHGQVAPFIIKNI